MTHTRSSARPDDTGRRRTGRSHLEFLVVPLEFLVVGLAAVIGVLAGAAAVVGVSARPEPVTASTARAATVELFGAGVYRYDTVFASAGNRGTDAVTLLVAVPVLVIAVSGTGAGRCAGG